MLDPVIVNAKNEFFIGIGKQGIHSFVMVGVMQNDGTPKLLARVGKANRIDKDRNKFCTSLGKALIGTTLTSLSDEPIESADEVRDEIHYQAYAINYDQVLGFLSLILEIENRLLKNKEIFDALERIDRRRIKCYVPTVVNQHQISFEYKSLKTWWNVERQYPNIDKVAKQTQNLSPINSCRTTALQITESIIGYKTGVSNNYITEPRYHGTLIGYKLCPDSFYILPPPPTVFEHLSNDQLNVARKLFKRLENIPKLNVSDPNTRRKFEKLKNMYQDITGPNNLEAWALLEKIMEHENKNAPDLYTLRTPNFFSRAVGMKSTTERLLTHVKSELQKRIN